MSGSEVPPGILDTSVVIALGRVDSAQLPDRQAITTITLGELSVGPLMTDDVAERAAPTIRPPHEPSGR